MFKNINKAIRTAKKINRIINKITKSSNKKKKSGNPSPSWYQYGKTNNISQVDRMTGEQFEMYCKELFEKQGYKVSTTKRSGDFGADLILEKNRNKIIVQVKRFKNNVGVSAIQEVVSALPVYRGQEAWVITNSYFTSSAIQLARANNVRLLNRDDLLRMM